MENKVGYTRRNLLVPLPLLAEIVRDGNDDLCDEALRLASQQGLADTESIRQCYYFIFRPEFHPQPLQLVQKTPGLADYQPDLSAYDHPQRRLERGLRHEREHGTTASRGQLRQAGQRVAQRHI